MSDSSLSGTIEFVEYQKPALTPGDYEITITQTVQACGDRKFRDSFSTTQSFSVYGPRFELTPQDIHSVFPPPGSRGDHNNVLPHIVFNRSTLPWEREVGTSGSWLALLVFYEEEKKNGQVLDPKICTLKKISQGGKDFWELQESIEETNSAPNKTVYSPKFSCETAQNEADKVTVVDVQCQLLKSVLPAIKDLPYLTHVRRKLIVDIPFQTYEQDWQTNQLSTKIRNALKSKLILLSDDVELEVVGKEPEDKQWLIKDKGNSIQYRVIKKTTIDGVEVLGVSNNDSEQAIIIANRLPKNNDTTTIHLVSLEGQYGDASPQDLFKYLNSINNGNSSNENFIRLVSLKSWSFSCLEPKYSFQGLLTHLNGVSKDQGENSQNIEVLLRLPAKKFNSSLEKYLSKGYVPLPHSMRKGDRTISWYHSPFIPWKNTKTPHDKLIQVSDQLLHYDPETGLFDVSYAAAWQLGRLLALQDKRLSVSLFNWKRAHLRHHHQCSQFDQCSHLLPQASAEERSKPLPVSPEDDDWFQRLNRLEDVPFNYLVPDERMLPVESIRFFWVDPLWVDCLLKGAFSIGETIELTPLNHCHSLAENRHQQMTGFLLRSEVVAGYPGLLVDGHDSTEEGKKLQLLRMERLSENVLLCLFGGEVKRVDIYQKPETLHFGFKDEDGSFTKELKAPNGSESKPKINTKINKNGVIQVKELASEFQNRLVSSNNMTPDPDQFALQPDQFALQMVEGTPLIRFKLHSAG